MYGVLLLAACFGYFVEAELFLVVMLAICGAIVATLMEKFYAFILAGMPGRKTTPPILLLALAVLATLAAAFFYWTGRAVGTTGFLLGIGIYCLQSLLSGRPDEPAKLR